MPDIVPKTDEVPIDHLAIAAAELARGSLPTPRGGLTGAELSDRVTSDPAIFNAAVARAQEMLESGDLTRPKAAKLVDDVVQKIADNLERINPSALPRVLDVVHKVTGWAEERAARLRAAADDGKIRATVFCLKPGDPDPPPQVQNEHRLIIDMRGTGGPAAHIIDVTPTEGEGGSDGA